MIEIQPTEQVIQEGTVLHGMDVEKAVKEKPVRKMCEETSYDEMNLSFRSKSQNERFSRTVVAAFVARLDPTLEELSDLKTAVSEAVTNAISMRILTRTAKLI